MYDKIHYKLKKKKEKKFIEILLIYSVVFTSGVHQSDSAQLYTYM